MYRSDYIRIQQQIMEYQEEARAEERINTDRERKRADDAEARAEASEAREALKDARIKELEELLAARQ